MSHYQRRIQLLKKPAFFLYMLGFLFAAIGNGLGYIAMSWIVVSHHSNVEAMAILMACFWGPNVLLGPVMGVLADRLSRKWLIFASNSIRAILYIYFSFYLKNHFDTMSVYILMFLIGVAFSIYYSSAFGFLRELVPESELMYANSTIDIIYEVGNVLGMGVAGLLIAYTSSETAILLNGLSFVIATITVFCISKKYLYYAEKTKGKKIHFIKDFKQGFHYLVIRHALRRVYLIQLLIFLIFITAPLLLLPFSKIVLNASAEQFGLIEASASVGIVLGGILMPWIAERYNMVNTLILFSMVLCFSFIFFAYNTNITIAIALYFLIGFAGAVWPLIISKAQSMTALGYQGRVQSTYNSISGSLTLLFYFCVGWMGKYVYIAHLYWLEVLIAAWAIFYLFKMKDQW
jgi:DHA3 family macrolide efflux protein-like MFS transporter